MSPPPSDRRPKSPDRAGWDRQSGAAVITAMLLVAIVAASASNLLVSMDAWIEHTELARDKAQATELGRNAITYARLLLATDARNSASDTLLEDWARELPPLRHEGAEIKGRIADLQGRFNLNNLRHASGVIDEQAYDAYLRLLTVLGLSPELADTLADWLDADDSRRAHGAEAADYAETRQNSNGIGRPLTNTGELARIRGYTPAIVARLQEHVSALSGIQAVNINTATPEVLSALQPGLSLSAARALADTRRTLPFRDAADFRTRLNDPSLPNSLIPISAASAHFLIQVTVDRGRARSRVLSLVKRQNDTSLPRILWQSIL